MAYAIGLDIGTTSVGYAVVALDQDENPWGIIRMGSRIFDAAENPKDGASLAEPRRLARGARRRLRRHVHRIERIRQLILSSGLLTAEQLDHLYDGKLTDIYGLRVKALDEAVTNDELARILLHLAQRRGFKSNRKSEASEEETGKLLGAISENTKRMQENGYRTVGEMFYKDAAFKEAKRNKGGVYITTVQRDMIEHEARTIIEKQMALGNKVLTGDFEDKYLTILLSQRNFDEGPGDPSPYAGAQIERMIGNCTFEPQEKRAAKACYSFEYFNLLQKINHLKLVINGESVFLTDEQRQKIIKLAKAKADLKYSHIRKELNLDKSISFNTVDEIDYIKAERKEKFNYLPFYHQIREILDEYGDSGIEALDLPTLDEIGRILTTYKSDDTRTRELSKLTSLTGNDISALLRLSGTRKFGHLSLTALRKINPFLEQGLIYNEACTKAGYDHHGHSNTEKTALLPSLSDDADNVITSSVARRAIAQAIKVVNAIIHEQNPGKKADESMESPLYVNIELAREMSKDFSERKKINNDMKKNKAENEELMESLKTDYHMTHPPTGLDLLKLKLWKKQDGISPYSQKQIDRNRLFEPGYVDIDHIIPYSKCFDDSYKNKVLVFTSENREKGNRLPLEYLEANYGQEAANKFIVYVKSTCKDFKKSLNLLKKSISEEELNRWKERSLQDTKTISSFLYNYINDHLLFAPSETGKKRRVTAVNGVVTSYLRKLWGIRKVRANGDKHHAVDALVVACTTSKIIRDLTYFSRMKETEYVNTEKESMLVNKRTGEILKRFPYPWEDFKKELEIRISDDPASALKSQPLTYYQTMDLNTIKPIFVSRMPRRKSTGPAHQDTIRSARHINEGIILSKKNLCDLQLDKNGEIKNYYAPESDTLLYNALKERLKLFNGDAQKAFAEPFHKPKSDGTPGPLVKRVKLYEKTTLNVPVLKGTAVAKNDTGSMVRVDVYKVENDGYYLVPIYVADTLKASLPNKAIIAHKDYAEWPEMDEKDFLFSLYHNDLIKFVHRNGVTFSKDKKNAESDLPDSFDTKEGFVYYQGTNISSGAITVITSDNTHTVGGLGVKMLLSLEKYQVDILGNYSKVKKGKRQSFH